MICHVNSLPTCLLKNQMEFGASTFKMEASTPGSSPISVSLHSSPQGPSVLIVKKKQGGAFTEDEIRGLGAVGRTAYLGQQGSGR